MKQSRITEEIVERKEIQQEEGKDATFIQPIIAKPLVCKFFIHSKSSWAKYFQGCEYSKTCIIHDTFRKPGDIIINTVGFNISHLRHKNSPYK